jgi:hypothetical protein
VKRGNERKGVKKMSECRLRDGCEPPKHGKVTGEDYKHPLYADYRRYRAAMTRQLVHCPSFEDWLEANLDDWVNASQYF